jgi:selenocysteine lyase/cysteine desulfurase
MKLEPQLGRRTLFPDLAARAYLAHAAVSPTSSAVRTEVSEWIADYATHGVAAALRAAALRTKLRGQLAQLLGADADDLGLVQSTTTGVIHIARSIPFRPGERILAFDGEFPANVTPWQTVAADMGLELRLLPLAPYLRSSAEGLAQLAQELARGARIVAVSAVQFQTGLRMPLREMAALCHAAGAELFVDAIQALGAVPCDVRALDIDYLVAGGHKFLMGLEGAGVLYVRPSCMAQLSLGLSGWTGHEQPFAFLQGDPGLLRYDRPLARKASFSEQGAISVLSCAALSASLEILLTLGVADIFAHVTHYLDLLEPVLLELGFESFRCPDQARRSASLCVRPPAGVSAADVARRLGERGVVVSTPDGLLRFAPHWPNSVSEIPLVESALAQALS